MREGSMPARSSHRRLIAFRSMWYLSPRFSMRSSIAGSSRAKKASATSLSVSKQHLPMLGPMAARSV